MAYIILNDIFLPFKDQKRFLILYNESKIGRAQKKFIIICFQCCVVFLFYCPVNKYISKMYFFNIHDY